ncbi:MAG: chromosomal replication initiator protein DnaA [Deltaproteobacteria bacterium]|nr:chromosomal replication initiator protein DnaA [Deltaproteobacteria bacterium]
MENTIQKIIATLQTKISGIHFNNWIKPTVFQLKDQNLIIQVSNKFVRDWISENYLDLIKYEVFKLTGSEHQVCFEICESLNTQKENLVDTETLQEANAQPKAEVQPASIKTQFSSSTHLNPKYSFQSFVVGSSNQFANAASRAVANLPALAYNPLFIYGGVGLGKTHLLNAIGLDILHKRPDLKVLYIHAEQFTNELINSIRYEKMFEFRKKYRESCDVLLIDDIQFIAGKERTQEEFFHTFNFLYESRKQVVLTSDRFPKDIPQLEERLRSRFEWGLIADIQIPDVETRVAILRKKTEADGLQLPQNVAMFLATHVRHNIRELEGSLIRLSAFASLSGSEITLEMAKEVLKDIFPNRSKQLSVEAIQKLVADHYQLKISDLKSSRRHKVLTVPRQIAMFLCRKYVKSSFPELGMKFGGKDHSTVVHAVQKITQQLKKDSDLQSEISSLEKRLDLEASIS